MTEFRRENSSRDVVRTSIDIPVPKYNELRSLAEERCTSISSEIRRGIRELIKVESLYHRAIEEIVAGRFRVEEGTTLVIIDDQEIPLKAIIMLKNMAGG